MLDIIAAMIQAKQLELEAKGWSPDQSAAAVRRSRMWAQRLSEKINPKIREQAFIDLFKDNISGAETWLENMQARMKGAA